MVVTNTSFADRIGFNMAEILGYTILVLSFLMVFVGIRSYRDKVNGGSITFKRALSVGLLITVVSCACYVATWEILYFQTPYFRGFMDKYAAYAVDQAKASGASAEAVEAQVQQMKKFKELYENPLYNMAFTVMEPLPVGLVVTLISAAVLRKKERVPATVTASVIS
jgi:hypothetical protein